MIGPIARPVARGLGPGLGLTYEIVLRAGPGLDILVAGRAGPGPHNSICGPRPGRVFTTAAGTGRAWASNHICGPGLGLDFRPVQDTNRPSVGLCLPDNTTVNMLHSSWTYRLIFSLYIMCPGLQCQYHCYLWQCHFGAKDYNL